MQVTIGKRNESLIQYINWPIGGGLYPKVCFEYISNPTDGPYKRYANGGGKASDYLTFQQVPSSVEILN